MTPKLAQARERAAPVRRGTPETTARLHDFDAERGVLGGALADPAAFEEIAGTLAVEDFFFAAHRQIFGAMLAVRERGQQVCLLTVHAELARRGLLKSTRRPRETA